MFNMLFLMMNPIYSTLDFSRKSVRTLFHGSGLV